MSSVSDGEDTKPGKKPRQRSKDTKTSGYDDIKRKELEFGFGAKKDQK